MFFKEIPLGFTRFQIVRQRHPASDYAQKAMAQAFANQTNLGWPAPGIITGKADQPKMQLHCFKSAIYLRPRAARRKPVVLALPLGVRIK